jgi:hypothetical protein
MRARVDLELSHYDLGAYHVYFEDEHAERIFCENETNGARLYGLDKSGFPKDAFHEYVIDGNKNAVSPTRQGTKAAAVHVRMVPAGGLTEVRLRISDRWHSSPFADFSRAFAARLTEANEFYDAVQRGIESDDARLVQRQALAGMIWSKQFYHFDVPQWLNGDSAQPAPSHQRKRGRNREWAHLNNADVISMPDQVGVPVVRRVGLGFSLHPAGADRSGVRQAATRAADSRVVHAPQRPAPAYEWAFGDVNPPCTRGRRGRVFRIDAAKTGSAITRFSSASSTSCC